MRAFSRFGALLTLAVLLFFSAGTRPLAAEEEGGDFTPIPVIEGMKLLPPGTPAPTFTVRDISGNDFDFSTKSKEKAHIIVFWSIFCEPCRDEMPIIDQIYGEFKDRDVEVLAVNLDGDPFLEGIKGYVSQSGYTFNVVLDELQGDEFIIADPYQVAGTPVLYLVDGKGMVFKGHLGRITAKDLRALVEEMLTSS